MLLRRVIKHVNEQNWTAIGIDLIIVVIGVFLGIQVSNWNDERTVRTAEKELIARLVSEASDVSDALEAYREHHTFILERASQLAMRLDEPECLSVDDNLKSLILGIADFPPPRFSLSNAGEALASGRVSIIQSPALRDSIRTISDEMAFINRQWQRYSLIKQEAEQPIYGAAGLALSGQSELSDRWEDVSNFQIQTPEGLCGNTRQIALVTNIAVTQNVYTKYLDELAVRLDGYLQALSMSK